MSDDRKELVQHYFLACSRADKTRLSRILERSVVHYRPSGKISDASSFIDHVENEVKTMDAAWIAETILCDDEARCAIAEWTSIKPKTGRILRGCSVFAFSSQNRICEVRVYFCATPEQNSLINELPEFPYRARSWTLSPVKS